MPPYVMRAGEHLERLAAERGTTVESIWNHAQNESLRAQRDDPRVLAAGDVVFPPEARISRQRLRPHTSNRYVATPPAMQVSVILRTASEAIANEACRVEGLPTPIETETDGEGRLELQVPATTQEVTVVVPGRQMEVALRVGALDPINTDAGVIQRLEGLGLLLGTPPRGHAEAPPARRQEATERDHRGERRRRLSTALSFFQHREGLPVTGEADDDTRTALARAYGDRP